MSQARDALLARLGRLPERRAAARERARAAIDRSFACEGVLLERWSIDGPRGPIPAYFLVREDAGPGPLPCVLALHPHGHQFDIGKSQVAGLVGDPTRAYGMAAARGGFAVLAPDLVGFEDHRPPLAARKANHALQGEAYERLLAMHALAGGSTLQGWMLADLSACLDALEGDRRVDNARIAVMGQSYGGQEALFAMLFDERLGAGVVSCGFSLVRMLVERSLSHNLALYLPGMLPDLDFDAIVPALAPRPLFVIAGRRDPIFPLAGVETVEVAARAAYGEAGAGDRLVFHYFEGGHDLPPAALQAALEWLSPGRPRLSASAL